MENSPTNHESDLPAPPATGDPGAVPLSNRFGLLAVIVVGVVLIATGLNAIFGGSADEAPPVDANEPVLGVSPAEMPRGALAGEPAPQFRLTMFDGSTFDLAEHITTDGRPIVLNFWASWCFPCRVEMPEFDEVARARPDVQFVGIAVEDNLAPALEFAEEVQVSYPLGFDETGEISGAYPHIGLPTTYLIAGDGSVARQVQGQITGALLEALIDFDFGTE